MEAYGTLVRTFKLIRQQYGEWLLALKVISRLLAAGTIRLSFGLLDGKLLRTLEGHAARCGEWRLARTVNIIASGSVDNTVKLWKLDGTELTTLSEVLLRRLGELPIARTGTFVVSVSEDNTLILWDVERILNLDLLAYGCEWRAGLFANKCRCEGGG